MGVYIQEFPGAMYSDDTLRLIIIAREIKKQNLQPKDINHIETLGELQSWNFVAPTDIQENIQHTWEDYHSFQGRAAQLLSDVIQSGAKLSQIGGQGSRSSGGTDPSQAKVDSPIVWTGSRRREITFNIPLMRWQKGAFADVFSPIHEFRKLGCAGMKGNIDAVSFPAIFEVRTSPADFIFFDYAALTDVQVDYKSPFIGGFPQQANLTLTFRDIRPLYRELWHDGQGSITTSMQTAGEGF
jgi:hypothetical protein